MRKEPAFVRGIFIDLIAMAGDSAFGNDGIIKLAEGVGVTDKVISGIIFVSQKQWKEAKKRLSSGPEPRIEIIDLKSGYAIKIINWEKYQSEYNRQKSYRQSYNKSYNKSYTKGYKVEIEGDIEGENKEYIKEYIEYSTSDSDKKFNEWKEGIISQWNKFALQFGLPRVKAVTKSSKRERLLRARFNEKEFDFPKILEKAARSDFLLGVKTDWRVSFDWLICPSNYIKVLEGNYDNNLSQKDSIKASRVGENKVEIDYPPGYWEKVRELRQKGIQGEAIREELMKIPEFYSFFQKQQGGTK